jgi:hypothetical protein
MRIPFLLCCVALCAPAAGRAEKSGVTICLVQANEGNGQITQTNEMDAKALAQYLSSQTLPNGAPIIPVVIAGIPSGAIDRVTEERDCEYVAQLFRHESVNTGGSYSPPWVPQSPASLQPLGLSPTDAPQFRDQSMILFTLRRMGSRKVIAHMAAPIPARWGRTAAVKFDPYPLFVKEITKKIAKAEGPN